MPRYGAAAQTAADAELARQGVRPRVLAENGMRFDAGGHETWAPVGIALVMTAIAFARKGDPELARIDVQSFLDVAEAAFPAGGPRTCRTCATSSSSAVRSWS
ncbi:hypothetical protein [Nocardia sp. NPDC050412]|uniref:hypothetical protein n=1 Tax=unclassified Nocardia TaxID=2637762 RepID=UPI0037B7ACC8